jgi:hypothetical protein
VEVIQLETARRLHFGHGLSFAEIDDLSILQQLRTSNESGLLWGTFQRFVTFGLYLFGILLFRSACRDVLTWPGAYLHDLPMFKSTFEDDQNGEAKVRLKNDLQARLGTLLESFCPNLNCVQPACPMHGGCSSKHRSPDLIII